MGIFNFFRRKPSENEIHEFSGKVLNKYFAGNRENIFKDAAKVLELTKFNVTTNEMAALLVRCIICRELGEKWTKRTLATLSSDCSGKLQEYELKWLMVYTDVNYVHKDSEKQLLLLMEIAGRKMGLPSPAGEISVDYQFD